MASFQGRGSAALIMLVAICVLLCVHLSFAAEYDVGDGSGWTLSSLDYTTWVQSKPIRVNDVLRFTYSAEIHNVIQVSQADYYQCRSSNPLEVYSNGDSLVTLTRRGVYYFICGVPGHCEGGMKMAVTVP